MKLAVHHLIDMANDGGCAVLVNGSFGIPGGLPRLNREIDERDDNRDGCDGLRDVR